MSDPTTPARFAELQAELEGFVRGSELTVRERLVDLEDRLTRRIEVAEARILRRLEELEEARRG